ADFVALDVEGSIRLAGAADSDLVDHVVFAAAPSDVTEVVVGGRPVVSAGRHVAGDVAAMLARAISRVRR
ncbi:MAG TPA: formimidoylglutamate deiminase, partial [Acidimicrobiia bacterium]